MLEIFARLGLDPLSVFTGIALSGTLVFFGFRRFLFSFFDPLSLFLLVLVGDATLMWALTLDLTYKLEFVAFTFCLWAGFAIYARRNVIATPVRLTEVSFQELKLVLVVLFTIIVVANLYLGASSGFPLLSLNPSASKVTVYTGGLGVIRRINMGPYFFFCSGCILLWAFNRGRRSAIAMLLTATFFIVLGGSKGVLLPIIFTTCLVFAHPGLPLRKSFKVRANRYMAIVLAAGLGVAILITTRDRGGFVAGVTGFLMRLLLTGDVILYYFPRREAVQTLVDPNFSGFLHNLFGDIFGLLRISDYQEALGTLILGAGDQGFGPNVQYFVQADLFFGPVSGCLFCFVTGYVISLFRNGFLHCGTNSAVWLSLRLLVAFSALDLAIDAGMYVAYIATAFLVVLPIWAVVRLYRIGLSLPEQAIVLPLLRK